MNSFRGAEGRSDFEPVEGARLNGLGERGGAIVGAPLSGEEVLQEGSGGLF